MADRRLRIFHAVAKMGSFTRAAESLFMSQPAVTFQIRQLEERYQVRLFERGHGQISLSPAGELVMKYAERLIDLSDEMETRLAEMTEEMRGNLNIGASSTLAETFMPTILSEFNALYPQTRPCLLVANSETIEQRVASHTLDVGLIDGKAAGEGVEADVCGEDELVVICAPDYPLAGSDMLTPKQLRDYEYINHEPGSGIRQRVEAYVRAAGMTPGSLKSQMELGNLESLRKIVATGLGFAITFRQSLAKEIESGQLVAISLQPALAGSFSILIPGDRFRSRLVTTFAEFAKQKLRGMTS
ncbi:MAG: regulatory protein LysR:LysR, substrate-binding protein [Proteobacteria bacterium]|nr:regulatory protein LysR:LysR, substrate-binding protein [Pseudomonadota bacterium]